jgi:predicted phosphoribosyltransferase
VRFDSRADAARRLAAALEHYRGQPPGRGPLDPTGRIAIVVDDGIATGASMIAALHAVREKNPQRLACAVPVAAAESLARIRRDADEMVCLEVPIGFHAVSQFYRDFGQVDEGEVASLPARSRRAGP